VDLDVVQTCTDLLDWAQVIPPSCEATLIPQTQSIIDLGRASVHGRSAAFAVASPTKCRFVTPGVGDCPLLIVSGLETAEYLGFVLSRPRRDFNETLMNIWQACVGSYYGHL